MTVMSPSKKKSAVVALSKWKMDCRFRKLSPLSCQLLSVVGTLVTNCRHILTQCRLSLKPLGRPLDWAIHVQYLLIPKLFRFSPLICVMFSAQSKTLSWSRTLDCDYRYTFWLTKRTQTGIFSPWKGADSLKFEQITTRLSVLKSRQIRFLSKKKTTKCVHVSRSAVSNCAAFDPIFHHSEAAKCISYLQNIESYKPSWSS